MAVMQTYQASVMELVLLGAAMNFMRLISSSPIPVYAPSHFGQNLVLSRAQVVLRDYLPRAACESTVNRLIYFQSL